MRDHKANLWCFGKKQTAKNELVTTRPAVPELGFEATGCSGFLPMVDASEGDLAAKFWPDSIPWLAFSLPPFTFRFLAVLVSGSLANPDALLSFLGGVLINITLINLIVPTVGWVTLMTLIYPLKWTCKILPNLVQFFEQTCFEVALAAMAAACEAANSFKFGLMSIGWRSTSKVTSIFFFRSLKLLVRIIFERPRPQARLQRLPVP